MLPVSAAQNHTSCYVARADSYRWHSISQWGHMLHTQTETHTHRHTHLTNANILRSSKHIYMETRMHSSRMHTGCALTVSGGGGWVGLVHPRRIFWGGKEIEKKKKKKFGGTPPRKFGGTPPENLEEPPQKIWRNPPRTRPDPRPCEQKSWHTPMKILPWPNFVAAGKNTQNILLW